MQIKDYFEKFKNLTPYIAIPKEEWAYILQTYEKEEIIDALSEVLFTYPPPIPNITEEETKKSLVDLKRTWWADILVEGKWFPRNERVSKYPLTLLESCFKDPSRVSIGLVKGTRICCDIMVVQT